MFFSPAQKSARCEDKSKFFWRAKNMKRILRVALACLLVAAMCVSAMATPSVSQDNTAPSFSGSISSNDSSIATNTDTEETVDVEEETPVVSASLDGEETPEVASVAVYDADGNEVALTDSNWVDVTAYSDKDTLDEESAAQMDSARDQVNSVSSLSELNSAASDDQTAVLLIDISADDETLAYLAAGGTLKVVIEYDTTGLSDVIVLHNPEGTIWNVVPSSVVDNGIEVTVTGSLSPFLVAAVVDTNVVNIDEPKESTDTDEEPDELDVDDTTETPAEEPTTDSNPTTGVVLALVPMAVAAAAVVASKRR